LQRFALGFLILLSFCTAKEPVPIQVQPAGLISALPAEIQEEARALLANPSEKERASVAGELARRNADPPIDFLISLLQHEESALVRRAVIHHLGRVFDPRVVAALKETVLEETEADLVVLASERLSALSGMELQRLMETRMTASPGDEESRWKLAREHERLWCSARGVVLPAWLRTPPPSFSISSEPSVRVLVFGDYGDGEENQRRVAAAMQAYHRQHPVDFGITVGDNFQDFGPESPTDPRWEPRWQSLYPAMKVLFFPALGNHDWAFPSGPAAEVLYSAGERYWNMPAIYYTFQAGPVQFFALDTNALAEAQLLWLRQELKKSQAHWKIVYGHHPIFSSGRHGDTPGLAERLLPLLEEGKVTAYLCGHDHHMEHLQDENLHFFICGTGGRSLRPTDERPPENRGQSLFTKLAYGFMVISADDGKLVFEFVDENLNTVYKRVLGGATWSRTTTQGGGCFGPRASQLATSGKTRGALLTGHAGGVPSSA
jgi:tartrate-resistant acid phosphatase type 5